MPASPHSRGLYFVSGIAQTVFFPRDMSSVLVGRTLTAVCLVARGTPPSTTTMNASRKQYTGVDCKGLGRAHNALVLVSSEFGYQTGSCAPARCQAYGCWLNPKSNLPCVRVHTQLLLVLSIPLSIQHKHNAIL